MDFNPENLLKHGLDPKNLPNLWKSLDHFQAKMAEVHGALSNPDDQKVFGEVLAQLQQAREEAQKLLPGAVEKMKADAEKLEVGLAELSKSYNEAKAEVERQQQARSAKRPPAPTPPPREHHVPPATPAATPSNVLRDELLRKMGKQPTAHDDGQEHDIWEDLTQSMELQAKKKEQHKHDQGAKPPPVPPPAPQEKIDTDWTQEW